MTTSSIFQDKRCIKIGEWYDKGNEKYETTRRVYSPFGLSPTICANTNDREKAVKVVVYGK